MIRILLQYLLPILLPTLAFVAWVYLTRQSQEMASETIARVRDGPWFWLIVAGIALMGLGLGYVAFQGEAPGGVYRAPHIENGRVVPGRVE